MRIFLIIVVKKNNFIVCVEDILIQFSVITRTTHTRTQTLSLSRHAMWIAIASNFAKIPRKGEGRTSDFSRNWNRRQGRQSSSNIEFRSKSFYSHVWKLSTGVNTFSRTRPDNVAGLFTSYGDSRWKPVIKLTEISRRVGEPIKSGRKSKTMVDRDIKTWRRECRGELSKFLRLDVFALVHRKPEALPRSFLSWRTLSSQSSGYFLSGSWRSNRFDGGHDN